MLRDPFAGATPTPRKTEALEPGFPRLENPPGVGCSDFGINDPQGDGDRLLLVFTNIIVNAFDAVCSQANGHGRLTITSECSDDYVVTRFADNGPGMSEEQVARAFEPFYTTKDPGSGTGLGLWVAHRVIQQHRGTIEIRSPQGEGTTVTVRLPTHSCASRPLTVGGDGI